MSGTSKPSGLKLPTRITRGPTTATASHRSLNEPEKSFIHAYALASAIFTNDDWPMRKKISDASLILTENTDDFIIGDRVWVGGTKAGHIQYIGETQFAPGEWAGIVLDEAIGKNDGSVAGILYFQCEPKRGVFSRLTKLSREPVQHLIDEEREAEASARANGSSSGRNSPLPAALGKTSSPASSISNLPRRLDATSSPRGSMQNLAGGNGTLKVGSRVMVHSATGTKIGVLKYLGATDFATGEWAGVELDDPLGKNDGSVAGKRYFACKPKYGLFAPTHKVTKILASPGGKQVTTPGTRTTLTTSGIGRKLGSQESLNSNLSSASNTARAARVRLGVTSLSPQKVPLKSSVRPPLTANHNAMQEALKEKEQHIEQLLKERDLERAEVARAAVNVEESERKLAALRNEHQQQIDELEKRLAAVQSKVNNSEKDKKELTFQLEEERRKIEDLQFRIEEEVISKGDLESVNEADAERIKQLQQALDEERKRAEKLETESSKLFQTEESNMKLIDELENMKEKLKVTESELKHLQTSKDEVGFQATHATSELARKDQKISELERKANKEKKEVMDLKKHLRTLEDNLEDKQKKCDIVQATVDVLTSKLTKSEAACKTVQQELNALKLTNSETQRKLENSDSRLEQLTQQKAKLEQDISHLMMNKGSSSEQLSKMNEELRQRESQLEELQSKLQNSSQKMAQLQDTLEQVQQQSKQETNHLSSKHREELGHLNIQLQNLTSELQRAQLKLQQRAQQHETEVEILTQKTFSEIKELKNEMEARDSQIGMLSHQIQDARRQAQDATQRNIQEVHALEEKLKAVETAKNRALKEREEYGKQQQDWNSKIKQLETENERLLHQQITHELAVKERDAKLATLTAEVERLRSEFANHRLDLQKKLAENQLEAQAMQDMHQQLDVQGKLIEELQIQLSQSEKEREELQESLDKMNALKTQNSQLENDSAAMNKQLQEVKHRLKEVQSENGLIQQKLVEKENYFKQMEDDHKKELSRFQDEKKGILQKTSSLEKLEQNKLQLSNKVVELQIALERAKECATSTDSMADVYRDEKLAAEGQIDFLNSVIVDMQKKNDQLQAKIQVLEAGPTQTDDINLNGIKTPVVLPRLFCDICDMFDLHDTEDCPTQVSSESPPPSQHHGNRNQVRPYCDTCEVFGHWTNQCNDDEMF